MIALTATSSFAQEVSKKKAVDFHTDTVLKNEKEFAVNPHKLKRKVRNYSALAGGSALIIGSSALKSSKIKSSLISSGVAATLLGSAYYLNKNIYENEYSREDLIKMLKKEAIIAQNAPELAIEKFNYKDVISKFDFSQELKSEEDKVEFIGEVIEKLIAKAADSENSLLTDDELKGILFKEFNDKNVSLIEEELLPILHLEYKTYEQMREDQRINDERREKWENSRLKKNIDKGIKGAKQIIFDEVKSSSISN